jgi:hypothetical protein
MQPNSKASQQFIATGENDEGHGDEKQRCGRGNESSKGSFKVSLPHGWSISKSLNRTPIRFAQ